MPAPTKRPIDGMERMPPEKPPQIDKLPFTAHLVELRKRLMVSLVAVLAGFLLAFGFSEKLFELLTLPLRFDVLFKLSYPFIHLAGKQSPSSLVFLAPAEAFWAHMKISIIAGLVVSIPFLLAQLWKFISPGLREKEKRYAVPFILTATGMFYFGAAFCFLIILPFAMKFLLSYKTAGLTAMISVERYIDFCLKFMLAFGVVFELPLVMVFATRMGLVRPETLAKNRKYAFLLAFVAAAILTPTPDAFNQTLMAVPIIILYEGGIVASRLFLRRRPSGEGQEP